MNNKALNAMFEEEEENNKFEEWGEIHFPFLTIYQKMKENN